MKEKRKKLLIITGPTATGKTDLAIQLAKKLNGELISCDSRQVYKGLDIGTGKLPGKKVEYTKHEGYWIIGGVKIWGYDIVYPNDQYSAGDYIEYATQKVFEILNSDKLPIMVGGTGFYIKALLEGLSFSSTSTDKKLRAELEKLSLPSLQKKLKELNSDFFSSLNNSDKHNKRRLIRYIEVFVNNEFDKYKETKGLLGDFDILKIGLTAPREILYQKIDKRVDKRIEERMIKEAEDLYKQGLSTERMKELGLEYRFLAEYIEGKLTKDEMTEKLKIKIHQYAKRQLTWFKKDKDINWFNITDLDFPEQVEKRLLDWYNS